MGHAHYCLILLSYLKVALASCSSLKASRFWSSFTSACSIAFWSWLWIMKSSSRFAISSSRSVTCSIPRRSSDSSWACWYVTYKLTFHDITMISYTMHPELCYFRRFDIPYPVSWTLHSQSLSHLTPCWILELWSRELVQVAVWYWYSVTTTINHIQLYYLPVSSFFCSFSSVFSSCWQTGAWPPCA